MRLRRVISPHPAKRKCVPFSLSSSSCSSSSSCIHARLCHPPCLEIESLSPRLPWQTDGLCSIWAPSADWKPLMGAEDDGRSSSPVSAHGSPWANFESLSVKLGLIATMEVTLSGTVLHQKVGCFLSFIPVLRYLFLFVVRITWGLLQILRLFIYFPTPETYARKLQA